jgi:ribonuclease BN (tRNA processing enzyme)
VGCASNCSAARTKIAPSVTVRAPVVRVLAAWALIVNGALYVIDAGDGVTRRLTRLGTNFHDIGTIFITHPHSDHTSGLGALTSVIHDANGTSPVDIYGPSGTLASVQGLLQSLNVNSEIRISCSWGMGSGLFAGGSI